MEDGDYVLHGELPPLFSLDVETLITCVESRAICYYIASKYADQGVKLLPDATDLKGNANFQKWASVEKDNWDSYASPLVFEKFFKP